MLHWKIDYLDLQCNINIKACYLVLDAYAFYYCHPVIRCSGGLKGVIDWTDQATACSVVPTSGRVWYISTSTKISIDRQARVLEA